MTDPLADISRRTLLTGLAAGTGAAALPTAPASAAMGRGPDAISVRADGTYETVPLARPVVRLGIVQSRVRPIDGTSAAAARRADDPRQMSLLQHDALRDALFSAAERVPADAQPAM
ncbi:MAG: hypothetical protein ACK4MT_03305, partial [Thermaurantiacus tibetensis]